METLRDFDTNLFLYLNNLGNPTWDWLWLGITNKWYSIPIYIFLLVLLLKHFGWKNTIVTLVFVTLLITCTDQLANVFKHGFERPRPCLAEGIMEQARFIAVRCGSFGYFSAHAASSMGLAFFIGNVFRLKQRYVFLFLILWALLVGYSRIYVGVHYPGDVITGMGIGGLIGYLLFLLYKWVLPKINWLHPPKQ